MMNYMEYYFKIDKVIAHACNIMRRNNNKILNNDNSLILFNQNEKLYKLIKKLEITRDLTYNNQCITRV